VLVGFANKGPLNAPVSVYNIDQLKNVFGRPEVEGDPNMLYIAEQWLGVGAEVIIYRVADGNLAKSASITIPGADNLVKTHSAKKGPYLFAKNEFFRWKVDGVLSAKTLVVLATDENGLSAQDLADELNDQLAPKDGIRFFVHQGEYLGIKT